MNINDYLIDLIVDAILEDICKDTSEWADPTGEKACNILELQKKNTSFNKEVNAYV